MSATEWVQGRTPVGPQTQLSRGSKCHLYSEQTGYGDPGSTTQTIVAPSTAEEDVV